MKTKFHVIPVFFWKPSKTIDRRSFKIFIFLDSTVTMGAAAYDILLPPVDRPRPFQSTVRVDEVMVNYSHHRRHAHQPGVRAIVHHGPWQFEQKNCTINSAAGHGLHHRPWTVRACSNQRRALMRTWATPPTTSAMPIDRGCEPCITINHGDLSGKISSSWAPLHMKLHCRPWAVRACSNQRRALIRSWATPPTTGAMRIDWGCEP